MKGRIKTFFGRGNKNNFCEENTKKFGELGKPQKKCSFFSGPTTKGFTPPPRLVVGP